MPEEIRTMAAALNADKEPPEPLYIGVLPLVAINNYGSTDVGDVQHLAPGVMFYTVSWNTGAPGHNWQIASCAGHSIGLKGMIHDAKVMASYGLKVMTDPRLLENAKKSLRNVSRERPMFARFPMMCRFQPRLNEKSSPKGSFFNTEIVGQPADLWMYNNGILQATGIPGSAPTAR